MMLTALLMRPWMEQMKEAAATPRILADDLQIITAGPRHLENLRYAFDLTHEHMEDMGAKIAPSKSVTFASNITSRKWLRNHKWRRLGKKVPLQTDMRDLGGHMNTAEKASIWYNTNREDEENTGKCENPPEKEGPIQSNWFTITMLHLNIDHWSYGRHFIFNYFY